MLVGKNFFHQILHGLAVTPTTLNSGGTAAVNGVTITKPWLYGRQISFLNFGGAFAATASVIFTVERQNLAGSWSAVYEADGTTPLAFTAAVDAGPLENGTVLGTIDVSRLSTEGYKAIRLVATNSAAANALVGSIYIISDLYNHPSGVSDDLFSKTIAS